MWYRGVRAYTATTARYVFATAGLYLLASYAMAQDALHMPLASRSLLLDVATGASRVVAVGERGHVLYSDDDGHSWSQADVPTRQMLTAVHLGQDGRGWIVGHDGLILATHDNGVRWVLQHDGLAAQIGRAHV